MRIADMAMMSLCLWAAVAVPQTAVPPPPRPVDSGPSLVDTMKFIQDKLNAQGRVGYVQTQSNLNAITYRHFYQISEVVADPRTCTLHKVETTDTQIEVASGYNYNESGTPVTGDNLIRKEVETSTLKFKDIKDLSVQSMQDATNRSFAQQAHPEIVSSITPEVFSLTLNGAGQVFSFHTSFTVGKQAPRISESPSPTDTLTIRDADTADRLAKAFQHAVELCGGGNKDPF